MVKRTGQLDILTNKQPKTPYGMTHMENETTQQPSSESSWEDTLIVPPPSFRERLLAAQRARALEARRSVSLPHTAEEPTVTEAETTPETPTQNE
jgi:hypothetical protein